MQRGTGSVGTCGSPVTAGRWRLALRATTDSQAAGPRTTPCRPKEPCDSEDILGPAALPLGRSDGSALGAPAEWGLPLNSQSAARARPGLSTRPPAKRPVGLSRLPHVPLSVGGLAATLAEVVAGTRRHA